MMNFLRCNLCGSNDIKVVASLKDFVLNRCKYCSLAFTELKNVDSLSGLYTQDYFEKQHPKFFAECVGNETNKGKLKLYSLFLKKIQGYVSGGNLLDVGFGSGTFLNEAKNLGFEVYGIDISEYAVLKSKKIYGLLNVFSGELTKTKKFEKNFFDIITMNDVLEHVDDPKAYLRAASSYLRRGGILMVYTINEDSFLYGLVRFLYTISLGLIKKPIELSYPRHHLYHFKSKHLKKYFKEIDFEIVGNYKANMPLSAAEGGLFSKFILLWIYLFSFIFRSEFEVLYLLRKK